MTEPAQQLPNDAPLSFCLRDCGTMQRIGHASFGEAAENRAFSPDCLAACDLIQQAAHHHSSFA
jgi:hypothetical protein